MKYKSDTCVIGEDGSKFFSGDSVSVYKKGVYCFKGVITIITCKGLYLNVGAKKDKYFRSDELDEISILEITS